MSGTTPNLRGGVPLPSAPLVDPDTGNVTSPWLSFLLMLYTRTGGGIGPSDTADDVAQTALLAALEQGDDPDGLTAQRAEDSARLAAWADLADSPPLTDPAQSVLLDDVQDAPAFDPAQSVVLDDVQDTPVFDPAQSWLLDDVQDVPVQPAPSSATPIVDGTAAAGTSLLYARQDHVHPTDTSRAPLAMAGGNAGRNQLHNSLFTVQQRGAGPFTASGYTADRWALGLTGDSNSVTIATLADADRAAIGDESALYAFQDVVAGAATAPNYSQISQRTEDVHRLSNQTVTVSFYAKASAALNVGVYMQQYFGSGGSPSAKVNTAASTVAVTTGWARFSVSFTLPSTSGKTLGTAGGDCTIVIFALSSGTTNAAALGVGAQSGAFSFWGMQIEAGAAASPLEKRPIGTDLMLCQRFYQSYPQLYVCGYGAASGTIYGQYVFPVPMRAVPTVVFAGQTYNNASAIGAVSVRASDLFLQASITAAGVGYAYAAITLSADL